MLRMTVMYPNGDDATFDWDYYQEKHAALLEEKWGPHMGEVVVGRGVRSLPKGEAEYLCVTTIEFADEDALNAALKAGGMDIPNDIPNFTNTRPVMQIEEIV